MLYGYFVYHFSPHFLDIICFIEINTVKLIVASIILFRLHKFATTTIWTSPRQAVRKLVSAVVTNLRHFIHYFLNCSLVFKVLLSYPAYYVFKTACAKQLINSKQPSAEAFIGRENNSCKWEECEVPLSIRDLTIGVMVGLVIGLVLGYAITGPNNSKLEQQIDQLESRVIDLQDQLESKDNQISDLQSQIEDKNTQINSLQYQIADLQSEIEDLQNQLTSKDNQILELQNQLADKETEISDLHNQISILQDQLDELQSQLRILNAPVSSFTTINDLKITIATHKHVYSYKEPVSGNVTVYYLNGTAFKGSFIIYIECLGDGSGGTSSFPVEGYGEFHVKSPAFMYGPGKYQIGISTLFDAEGFIIENRINLFPYVEVEAK